MTRINTPADDKEHNKIKQVLFDPGKVGWDKGLEKAIEDAKGFGVPLAVENEAVKSEIELRVQNLDFEIIIDRR